MNQEHFNSFANIYIATRMIILILINTYLILWGPTCFSSRTKKISILILFFFASIGTGLYSWMLFMMNNQNYYLVALTTLNSVGCIIVFFKSLFIPVKDQTA
jgi:hypothetical protein